MREALTDQLRRHYQGPQFQPTSDFVERISHALVAHPVAAPRIGRPVIGRRLFLVAVALLIMIAIAAIPVAASTSPLAVFSRYLLSAAGLGPVVQRIMPATGRAASTGYTLDLVGTYADDTRTIVILKASPGARVDQANLVDASGRGINQLGATSNDETGDNVLAFGPVAGVRSGHVKVTLFVAQLGRGSPGREQTIHGLWTLQFDLTAQGGRSLPAPQPGQAGRLAVRFDSVVAVPGALAIEITTVGATPDEWMARYGQPSCITNPSGVRACSRAVPSGSMNEVVAVYDTNGNALGAPSGVGASINTEAELNRKEAHWRSLWTLPGPGAYRIVVQAPDGAKLERVIQVH